MKTTETRQVHLAESKALLDKVMNEANLTNQRSGIDRLSELAGNLEKFSSSEALGVANARLEDYTKELSRLNMTEEDAAIETEAYKAQLVNHLRQGIRERI